MQVHNQNTHSQPKDILQDSFVGGQMTQTDAHTNIYSIFRDKLSLLRELV
jgi:hypothetical protein